MYILLRLHHIHTLCPYFTPTQSLSSNHQWLHSDNIFTWLIHPHLHPPPSYGIHTHVRNSFTRNPYHHIFRSLTHINAHMHTWLTLPTLHLLISLKFNLHSPLIQLVQLSPFILFAKQDFPQLFPETF